jgi:hypothetical protein
MTTGYLNANQLVLPVVVMYRQIFNTIETEQNIYTPSRLPLVTGILPPTTHILSQGTRGAS